MSNYTTYTPNRQIVSINQFNLFLLIVLVILGMIVLFILRAPHLAEYNKYMCANYGYYEDCKTPLAPEDRLK